MVPIFQPVFLQTTRGQYPVQPGFLSLLWTTQCQVRGLVFWLFALGSLGKAAIAPKDLDHCMGVCSGLALDTLQVCCVNWRFNSAPTEAAGETLVSVPHLQSGRRALHKQGWMWWSNVLCQEPWCHENFVKGLINVLASGWGEERLNLLRQLLFQCLLAKLAA